MFHFDLAHILTETALMLLFAASEALPKSKLIKPNSVSELVVEFFRGGINAVKVQRPSSGIVGEILDKLEPIAQEAIDHAIGADPPVQQAATAPASQPLANPPCHLG